MPRRRPDDAVKSAMWGALLEAAKRHHNHPADHGMVTVIARDAQVSKASVSEWKNLISYPEDATLRRLADLYQVSAESISGYKQPDYEGFGAPDELLRRASDLTADVCATLLPEGSVHQFVAVMNRAHELLLDGHSDDEALGKLFREFMPCGAERKAHQNGTNGSTSTST